MTWSLVALPADQCVLIPWRFKTDEARDRREDSVARELTFDRSGGEGRCGPVRRRVVGSSRTGLVEEMDDRLV